MVRKFYGVSVTAYLARATTFLGALLLSLSFMVAGTSVAMAAGTINGHVYLHSNAPLAGAQVSIHAANGQGGTLATVTTAADGSFSFNVNAGTWILHVETGQFYYGYDLNPITVADGQTINNQDFYVGPRDVATVVPGSATAVPTALPTSTMVPPTATSTMMPTPMSTPVPPSMPKTGHGGVSNDNLSSYWLPGSITLALLLIVSGLILGQRRKIKR